MVPLLAGLGSVTAAAATLNSILNLYPPFATGRARFTYNISPNMLPDLGTLAHMYWRGEISETDYYQQAREIGFDQPLAQAYQQSLRQILGAGELVKLYRRGDIDLASLTDQLHKQGYAQSDVDLILKATEYFPPPPDLIRFAVREVYNEATRQAFGMDEDISQRFLDEALKAGLPKEQAANYWASHWELPSVNQGFEMLQRRVIDRAQLGMLLKALDVMPFWRDALLKISYNPLTRVDVRRMHAMGIFDEAELQRRYEAEGFSPEDAALMTRFTVAYNTKDETATSQSKIVEAYKKSIITEDQARAMLAEANLSTEAIDLTIRTADFDIALDSADQLKIDLFTRYTNGEITIEDVRQGLSENGVPASYVASVMGELGRKVSTKVKVPSKEDLLKWLDLDLIPEETFKLRMQQLGYRESDVLLYLAERLLREEEPVTKYLANTVYIRWVKKGMITRETAATILQAKGVREEDIGLLLDEVTE